MSLPFIVGALCKGLKATLFFANYWPIVNILLWIVFIYSQIRALMETPAWYFYAMWCGEIY